MAIGFTGDLGRSGLPILKDPASLPPVDYLVCESTYGDRLHDPIDTAEEELAQVIRQAAESGGRVIVPAFAVERTQELIYFLHRLHDAGRIPAMPVFVDSPMAVSATAIFKTHEDCFDADALEFLARGASSTTSSTASAIPATPFSAGVSCPRPPWAGRWRTGGRK